MPLIGTSKMVFSSNFVVEDVEWEVCDHRVIDTIRGGIARGGCALGVRAGVKAARRHRADCEVLQDHRHCRQGIARRGVEHRALRDDGRA